MEIKVHVVGRIASEGRYKDWYVFIQTYKNNGNYLVLKANNKMFGRDDGGNLIAGSEGYDEWLPNIESVENYFEVNGWKVEWLEDQKLKWLKDEAE